MYKFKKNTIRTKDSWMGIGDKKFIEYFTLTPSWTYIKYTKAYYRGKMQPYLGYWFIEDEQKQGTTREVLTIWDVLEDFGGIMEIIMIFAALTVGWY